MRDHLTKFLLATIAVGLWGLILQGELREQQSGAGVVLELDGMVKRLAVVDHRAGVEEDLRQCRVAELTAGAVEHGKRPVAVDIGAVRVGAAFEQQPGSREQLGFSLANEAGEA